MARKKMIGERKMWLVDLGDEIEPVLEWLYYTRQEARANLRAEKPYFPDATIKRVTVKVEEV